jgi:glycerol-3-phosphate dehydrogenase
LRSETDKIPESARPMNAPAGISTLSREKTFQSISGLTFDVLVIGGGIMGAGIALDAASRNLKVLLVEKQDFAAGTSSRSTKLIHGGLRYLKNLEFGLVRSVARERRILHQNAPHLVVPEPMLLPVLENASYGYWATAAGLTLYDWLGNVDPAERHRMLGKNQTLSQEPLLNPTHLKGAGRFFEYRTDDARLTLEVLKTAESLGATCLNYTELTGFTYSGNNLVNGGLLKDQLSGKSIQINTRCAINATGPWSALLAEKDQVPGGPQLYHTKGVHLVVPFHKLPLRQSVYFDIPGNRMLFAIPRHDSTYLGTTDTAYSGNLENPEVTLEDATYILDQINQMFPQAALSVADVVSSWAGIRPLLFEAGKKPTEISRKEAIHFSKTGLVTVAGGKLTGYRHLAELVVNKTLSRHFPDHKQPSRTKTMQLSGGNFASPVAVNQYLEACLKKAKTAGYAPETVRYLVRTYGTNTTAILQQAAQYRLGNLTPAESILKAEIWYTIGFEGATNLSDFLIRRAGKLYFEREKIEGLLPAVLAVFREILNWNEATADRYLKEFYVLYEAAVAFKKSE